jgi:hypothetical protein
MNQCPSLCRVCHPLGVGLPDFAVSKCSLGNLHEGFHRCADHRDVKKAHGEEEKEAMRPLLPDQPARKLRVRLTAVKEFDLIVHKGTLDEAMRDICEGSALRIRNMRMGEGASYGTNLGHEDASPARTTVTLVEGGEKAPAETSSAEEHRATDEVTPCPEDVKDLVVGNVYRLLHFGNWPVRLLEVFDNRYARVQVVPCQSCGHTGDHVIGMPDPSGMSDPTSEGAVIHVNHLLVKWLTFTRSMDAP